MEQTEIQPPKAPPPNVASGITKKQTKISATWNLYR